MGKPLYEISSRVKRPRGPHRMVKKREKKGHREHYALIRVTINRITEKSALRHLFSFV